MQAEPEFRKLGKTLVQVFAYRLKPIETPRAVVFVGLWWTLAVAMIGLLASQLGIATAMILTLFPGSLMLFWGASKIARYFR
jgi:hypothetical protein